MKEVPFRFRNIQQCLEPGIPETWYSASESDFELSIKWFQCMRIWYFGYCTWKEGRKTVGIHDPHTHEFYLNPECVDSMGLPLDIDSRVEA